MRVQASPVQSPNNVPPFYEGIAFAGISRSKFSCESKIDQAKSVWNILGEQDVIWFEIAMNDSVCVNVS